LQENLLGLHISITDTEEWKDLETREFAIGPDNLMTEIIEKKLFSNVEIMWILKKMVYFYGKKDALLKVAPPERIMTNMSNIVRAFYILFDLENPAMDDNIRSYISTRLIDATWGINSRTREYLTKIK
jgi:hypothetical protein